MKLRSLPRGPVQENCFQHELEGSLRYALCLSGVVTGADGVDLARCLANDATILERELSEKIMVESLRHSKPGILPGADGPILVLMVL